MIITINTVPINSADVLDNLELLGRDSAWNRGIRAYADELLDGEDIAIDDVGDINRVLLNGAENWHQYSSGGCALICDCDIAERLCTKTELRRNRNGELPPNRDETWLDVQARALYQAAMAIWRTVRNLLKR